MKSEEFGSISIIKPKYDQYLYQINNDDFKSKISLTFDMDKCKKMEVFYHTSIFLLFTVQNTINLRNLGMV